MFEDIFIPCIIHLFCIFPVFLYSVGKLGSQIFRKDYKNELHLLLVSLLL
jgi:hypothetical protein